MHHTEVLANLDLVEFEAFPVVLGYIIMSVSSNFTALQYYKACNRRPHVVVFRILLESQNFHSQFLLREVQVT